jgi:hypothetical protein
MSTPSTADRPARPASAGRAPLWSRAALWVWSLVACPVLVLAFVAFAFGDSHTAYGLRIVLMLSLPALLSGGAWKLASGPARQAGIAATGAVVATWLLVLTVVVYLSLIDAYS